MAESGLADAFTHLKAPVRDALSERGFSTPTEPQRRAIPPLARGENALVVAPTGTGKTETAMLPVLDAIADADPRFGISALYVTPLRALNRDMRERLDWWGDQLDLEVDVRHGDTTDYQRRQQATDPPDVLVTTPETLQAMLTGEKLREALSDVHHVVVDEVHELAAAKRGAQLTVGLERLTELAGEFQRVGLSATVGDPREVGKFLTGERGCTVIEIDAGSKTDLEVTKPEVTPADEQLASELLTDPETASHVRAIRDIVAAHDSTLIFVNTRQTAEALGSRFNELDANIGVHHGSLSKDARIETEAAFKAGELDGLLCTSSMELGIDVGRIDHVVQYQSPREVARLLQRVGRAGHRRELVSSGTVITSHPDDAAEAMAIARQASAGEVEDANIHEGSLDTLANQIVGVVMDTGEISARGAYELVTRAYPFRNVDEETFKSVVEELSSNRLLWLEEDTDTLQKSGGTWQYFYANLSMIADEETYTVRDMATGSPVGTLDERFVVDFAESGATFIQRGEMWRVNDVDEEENQVNVSPIEDPAGEVPSWVGEQIPVPDDVATEVGELRRVAAPQFEAGADLDTVSRDFSSRYPADERAVRAALEPIEKQVEADAPMPTDERLVIERDGRKIVLIAPFGHKVNETIGRMLASLLGQQAGSAVGMEIDPYRIELETPGRVRAADVRELLEDTDPDHLRAIIELALKRSDTLKFTLVQVAAKFGAIKRWKGDVDVSADRLLAALEDTPVYEEAVRVVFHDDLAIDAASEVLERIQSGDLEISVARERTPIGINGRSAGTELLAPENADSGVVDAVKERLLDDDVRLFCVHCTEWDRTRKVERVSENPECPLCGSTRIAALSPYADEVVQAVRSGEKDDDQRAETERAYRNASLVQGHGKRAVIALSARGVGPRNAARVINNHRESEADFYRDILEREREYARTKAFWD